jgi:predicted TIM-barrel fold metal-dependent hydrolase
MNAAPPILISADGHVTEPGDLWARALPAGLRGRGPRIEARDGRVCFVVEDRVVRKLPVPAQPEWRAAAGGRVEFGWGASEVAERLAVLDRDGVWAEVLYPNVAFFCAFAIEDAALQVATCEVYNDWVAERFGAAPRFAPVGLLPVRDVPACVRLLGGFAARGLRAGLLPCHHDSRPYNDPAYEPLWEAAAAHRIPLSFHAGTGRSQTPAHGPGAAVVNYVVTVSGPMETVAMLCAAGVLGRHPGLRVAMIECGAGWLAWTLDAMDDAYREHAAFVRPRLSELPSAFYRRQGAVTFQRDPVGVANASRTGAGCLMWGSDYPHPEGTFPESRRIVAEQLVGVSAECAERIAWRNAAEWYGLAPPASAKASAAGARGEP